MIRNAARKSIGSVMPAKSLELKHTINMIRMMDDEIAEIEAEIKKIMDKLNPPLLTIPGIGLKMGAMILAEVGDFFCFQQCR